jgi:osmotically-inducible protein OsmY
MAKHSVSSDGTRCSIEANQEEMKMKALHSFKLAGISLLLIAGLAACDKPGPAETAGKKIDQTAEAAGKKIEQTAESAARKINDTTDKVGEKMGEQSANAGVVIDDAEITAKVKAAIFAEPGLKTLQIGVDTVKGVVTLTGSVDSPASSDRVKSLAAATAGVKDVDNKLATKSIKTN